MLIHDHLNYVYPAPLADIWRARFAEEGLPRYSSDDFTVLRGQEQCHAKGEYIAFGTGPLRRHLQMRRAAPSSRRYGVLPGPGTFQPS